MSSPDIADIESFDPETSDYLRDEQWEYAGADLKTESPPRREPASQRLRRAVLEYPGKRLIQLRDLIDCFHTYYKLVQIRPENGVLAVRKLKVLAQDIGFDQSLLQNLFSLFVRDGEENFLGLFSGLDVLPPMDQVRSRIVHLLGAEDAAESA